MQHGIGCPCVACAPCVSLHTLLAPAAAALSCQDRDEAATLLNMRPWEALGRHHLAGSSLSVSWGWWVGAPGRGRVLPEAWRLEFILVAYWYQLHGLFE
jgi:hypothetical protein